MHCNLTGELPPGRRSFISMPLFFFHVDGDDFEGTELPDEAAARLAARETFGMMIHDGSVPEGGTMEVVDEVGRRIVTLKFLEE